MAFSEKLLPCGAVSKLLALPKSKVLRLNEKGKIPEPLRIDGEVRWKASDIELFLACDADMNRFAEITGKGKGAGNGY